MKATQFCRGVTILALNPAVDLLYVELNGPLFVSCTLYPPQLEFSQKTLSSLTIYLFYFILVSFYVCNTLQ